MDSVKDDPKARGNNPGGGVTMVKGRDLGGKIRQDRVKFPVVSSDIGEKMGKVEMVGVARHVRRG